MPKRVLDGEGMWSSTKLSNCPEWAIPWYAWLYPLADANGSFEITNSRVLWGKVGAILPNLTMENLSELLRIFQDEGLLFIWNEDGKKYAHWTGSEKPGRLPQPARRTKRYGPMLAPPVPAEQLREYMLRHQKCRTATVDASPVLVLGLGLEKERECASHTPAPAAGRRSAPSARASQPSEATSGFEDFWWAYPRKRAKQDTIRAWRKIRPEEVPTILAAIERWKQTDEWRRDGGRYIPYPATFLNGRRWEDQFVGRGDGKAQPRSLKDENSGARKAEELPRLEAPAWNR